MPLCTDPTAGHSVSLERLASGGWWDCAWVFSAGNEAPHLAFQI